MSSARSGTEIHFYLYLCQYTFLCEMSILIMQGLSGGTTVSGTMIAAHKAGIPVFVTGGIGGVHRDGENCTFI